MQDKPDGSTVPIRRLRRSEEGAVDQFLGAEYEKPHLIARAKLRVELSPGGAA